MWEVIQCCVYMWLGPRLGILCSCLPTEGELLANDRLHDINYSSRHLFKTNCQHATLQKAKTRLSALFMYFLTVMDRANTSAKMRITKNIACLHLARHMRKVKINPGIE